MARLDPEVTSRRSRASARCRAVRELAAATRAAWSKCQTYDEISVG
jgi:hypothetical protein